MQLRTTYKKENVNPGVLHIGFGAFHKAHQAVYFDDYMELTNDLNWGIFAINLKNESVIEETDYTIKIDEKYRKVRSHIKFYDYSENQETCDKILKNHNIRIITITVTEGGYNDDSLVYKYLTKALSHCDYQITILSCDNLIHNGIVLKEGLLKYLNKNNQRLKLWVEETVWFPSCTVDRITPKPKEIICTENYSQWVIENKLPKDFPDLTIVGVIVTKHIFTYENIKLRMLNATHTLFAYYGLLLNLDTFDELLKIDKYKLLLIETNKTEIIPTINCEIQMDLDKHLDLLLIRFLNARNRDSLRRIGSEGVTKIKTFVVPIIDDCFRLGIMPKNILHCVASWYIYSRTSDYKMMDSQWEWISLKNENIWGNLIHNQSFVNYLENSILLQKNTKIVKIN